MVLPPFGASKAIKAKSPLLWRVALQCHSIPLSFASVERVFSKLARMESPLRMLLLDESVRCEHVIQCHKCTVEGKLHTALSAHAERTAAIQTATEARWLSR